MGIESSLNLEKGKTDISNLKEGLNKVSEDTSTFAETDFYLNYFSQVKLVYFLKDT